MDNATVPNLTRLAGDPRFWEMRDNWKAVPDTFCERSACNLCCKRPSIDHLSFACTEVFALIPNPGDGVRQHTIEESSVNLNNMGFVGVRNALDLSRMLNAIKRAPCQTQK